VMLSMSLFGILSALLLSLVFHFSLDESCKVKGFEYQKLKDDDSIRIASDEGEVVSGT